MTFLRAFVPVLVAILLIGGQVAFAGPILTYAYQGNPLDMTLQDGPAFRR